jgi:hypothetical protein
LCRFHENDAKTVDKERFEVQNAANTGEIAASRFKMLHIVRKMDRTGNPPKKQNEKKQTNTIPDPFQILNHRLLLSSK